VKVYEHPITGSGPLKIFAADMAMNDRIRSIDSVFLFSLPRKYCFTACRSIVSGGVKVMQASFSRDKPVLDLE
jgi:hypothetical protein